MSSALQFWGGVFTGIFIAYNSVGGEFAIVGWGAGAVAMTLAVVALQRARRRGEGP